MTERVKRLKQALDVPKYKVSAEKLQSVMQTLHDNAGWPLIYQRALCTANYLDKKTIFIEPDELIVGNFAPTPMGMEARTDMPMWPEDEWEDLFGEDKQLTCSEEDHRIMRSYDEYWANKGRTKDENQGFFYDSDRLWDFISRGFLCPPWKDRKKGRGSGGAGQAWGMNLGCGTLYTPDFGYVINTGIEEIIRQCEEELDKVRYYNREEVERSIFLRSALVALPAILRLTNRYADLAEKMAAEEKDAKRAAELREIAEICRRVPAKPARNFREAIQCFFFQWCLTACGTTPGGRFDEYMGPYYKKDLEEGKITYEEGLELCECLRIKIMQFNSVVGGKMQREKWAGMARWHNFILGGTGEDGKDVTNDVSYMMLEAARETMTPHPTLTVRVYEGTPDKLLRSACETIKTGLGMPAMISEASYRNFVMSTGVPYDEANKFAIAGCLDVQLPGKSYNNAFGMFEVPCVLELALFNGKNPATGKQHGKQTGDFTSFKTFDEFYDAFLVHLQDCMKMVSEEHNILQWVSSELYPDVVHSVLLPDGPKVAKDILRRKMLLQNSSGINMVGAINTVNSLYAIKKLVFEDKTVSSDTMIKALSANWEGYEDVRKLCLEVPKYGNNIPEVDAMAKKFFDDYPVKAKNCTSTFGTPCIPSGISITAHAPGGSYTGATPDGRMAGETFADGSTSPVQGTDKNGPLAIFNSAMQLNQDNFMATLMNMKFHTSAFKTDEDLDKLGALIKTYLTHGGKHVQFNVADSKTLEAAKKDKAKYKDLVVRVAGYSSYFVVLTPRVQDEIIKRTEQSL